MEAKINLHKCCCVLLCVILLFAFLPIPASAVESEPETIRVGWYEDSYHISGENGERSGYGYEYEQSVSAYTGWKYEYIRGDWAELLGKLQKGEIDLMAAISYTEERAETMLFSELPMGEEKYYLYVNLADSGISASDLSTLNGKKIVVMEESVQATQFHEWEARNNVQTQHLNIDSFEKAKEMALNNEIDGVVSTETPAWVEAGMSAIATTGGSGIYYGINKNRPDIKSELDSAMRKMEYDKPFYADDLYEKYLSSTASPVLTNEELDWLAQHGEIRIGYLNNDCGVSVYDPKTEEMSGVICDYITFAADCLSNYTLKFALVGYDTREEQLQALKDGSIDLIFHVSQNPYAAEQNDLSLSNTIWTFNLAALTTKDYLDEYAENSVAVLKDNLALKWYLSYNYPKWKIIEFDTHAEIEKAVQSGQADCFVTGSNTVAKYLSNRKYHSVFLTQPGHASFAVNRGDVVLLSILNKTLKTMPASMLSGALTIYDNALNQPTVADFIKEHLLVISVTGAAIFLAILVMILCFLRKSRLSEAKAKQAAEQAQELNRQLQESQEKLQKALVQAESASEAKTNFLFNMSHDIRTPMNALLGFNDLMKKELTDPKLLHYQEKIEQSGNLLLAIINNVLDMARIESGKMEIDENYSRVDDVLNEICGVFDVEAEKKGVTLKHEAAVTHNHVMCDVTKIKQVFINLVSNAVKYTPSGGTVIIRSQELPCDKEGYVTIRTEVIDNGIGMSREYLPSLFESFTRERNTTTGKIAGTGLGMPIVKKLVDMMGGTIEVESELCKGSRFTVTLQHKIADEQYYKPTARTSSADRKEFIQGKRILLAEDNDLNAEIATTILEDMGLTVDRVEDGIQCVSRMEQKPAGSYDLIFMDIQMPHMDGYKAAQAIRRLSDKEKADIPIVAMTANAFEEDRKEALSNGMNGHIAKPIDVEKVEEILISLLN